MASETVKPVGVPSALNWHRFGSKAFDALQRAFEATADRAEQVRLSNRMQLLFAQQAAVIPLFPNPAWGTCNTRRFTGFPSKANPYAKLTPNSPPEYLLVLTRLRPR
jgi:peptide/nickel transport system substrate-binding protein